MNISIDTSKIYQQIDAFPLSKAVTLSNGFVRWIAPIARATMPGEKGFLNIHAQSGQPYYQRVSRKLLEKTKNSFIGLPATLGHPLKTIDVQSGKGEIRGLGATGKDTVFQVDAYQFGVGTIFDEELIKAIRERVAREISPGYGIKLTQTDAAAANVFDQVDRIGNHIAFVPLGRNGANVALQLDSTDDQYWDFAASVQYDEAELEQIKREIKGIPESFLDLSYTTELINLDTVALTPPTPPLKQIGDIKKMATLQLVTSDDRVITVEGEQNQLDALQVFVSKLKGKVEEKTIALTGLQTQLDAATAQSATLQTQLDAKPEGVTATLEQTDEGAIQKEAQKLALNFVSVVPHIMRIDPTYQFDSVCSLPEMHRKFLILSQPAKKAEFEALQLDGSEQGRLNAAKLEGMFNVLSTQMPPTTPGKLQQQNDAQAFSAAFSQLLNNPASTGVVTQHDASEQARSTYVAAVDKNF